MSRRTIIRIGVRKVAKPTISTSAATIRPASPVEGRLSQISRALPSTAYTPNIGMSVPKTCPISKEGSLSTRYNRKGGAISQSSRTVMRMALTGRRSLRKPPRK